MDWEAIKKTEATFGSGFGVRVICQTCGERQRVRLKRGCKVSLTSCIKCGQRTLKRAVIDKEGKITNAPTIPEEEYEVREEMERISRYGPQ